MKLEQYRLFDLILLSVLAMLAELLGNWLLTQFPTAGFYLSFSFLVAIIALFRWSSRGAVVSCLIALPAALFSGTISLRLFLFYFISNGSAVLVPMLFKRLEHSDLITKSYWFLGYVTGFYGLLLISRGLLGFLVDLSFSAAVSQTVSQLLFSMVMSYIVLLLLKNKEGLLADMNVYFINEQKEIEK